MLEPDAGSVTLNVAELLDAYVVPSSLTTP